MTFDVKKLLLEACPIDCWCETIHDEESLKNIESYGDLVRDLVEEITKGCWLTEGRYEHSAKQLNKRYKWWLEKIKEIIEEALGEDEV